MGAPGFHSSIHTEPQPINAPGGIQGRGVGGGGQGVDSGGGPSLHIPTQLQTFFVRQTRVRVQAALFRFGI